MRDPYEALGVQKTDSEAAIRAAYRKLAKRHHPDLNPNKPEAAERFKEISAAWEILSDKEKRGRYDRGEIDAAGNETPKERHFYRDFGDAPGRERYRPHAGSGFTQDDIDAFYAQAFGQAARERGGQGFSMRGPDAQYSLTISFIDAANGATRRLTLPDGHTLDVRIPAGVRDGHILRLKGQGMPGIGKGPPGDALIEITVAPDPIFRREGNDIIVELPVTIKEAVLGASVEVPTIRGRVRVTIPANSGTGTRLRLRGRGIGQHGHQFVELNVVVPPGEEPELSEFLKNWTPRHDRSPRSGMGQE
jgi:DnaJ-class molecular chaperone